MAVESREHRQDHALVLFLQALPEQRLERILLDLGITSEKVADRRQADLRRCKVCNHPYIICRSQDERAPVEDRHPWTPDRNRKGEQL